jgi:hypothetical protein
MVLEILDNRIRQEKEIHIWEETELYSLADEIIVYIENLK